MNSLGPGYCDGLCLALSRSLCRSPSLYLLQPPGPDRVHCSLHGNCIMLSVFFLLYFSELPPPPLPTLLCCCWVPQVHSAAAPSSLIYLCIVPAALLPSLLIQCSSGFLGTGWLTVFSDGDRHHGGGWRRDGPFCMAVCTGCHGLLVMLYYSCRVGFSILRPL